MTKTQRILHDSAVFRSSANLIFSFSFAYIAIFHFKKKTATSVAAVSKNSYLSVQNHLLHSQLSPFLLHILLKDPLRP
jgi:hypothetical protein